QRRDAGGGEAGEDLALGDEAAPHVLARPGAGVEHLDRQPLAEGAVGALGEEDAAHAAAADLLEDAVAVDELRDGRRLWRGSGRRRAERFGRRRRAQADRRLG